jgi:hypothetical protein
MWSYYASVITGMKSVLSIVIMGQTFMCPILCFEILRLHWPYDEYSVCLSDQTVGINNMICKICVIFIVYCV